MSGKGRPQFSAEERHRILAAKVELACALDDWIAARASAEAVVNAVEKLMLAVKILKEPMCPNR